MNISSKKNKKFTRLKKLVFGNYLYWFNSNKTKKFVPEQILQVPNSYKHSSLLKLEINYG